VTVPAGGPHVTAADLSGAVDALLALPAA